jgi:hypothetical protein
MAYLVKTPPEVLARLVFEDVPTMGSGSLGQQRVLSVDMVFTLFAREVHAPP